jgi:flagellin-specific chaperone FliS
MNAYKAYQHSQNLGLARIDLILSAYDGVKQRLEQARAALAGNPEEARKRLLQARLIISSLASATVANTNDVGNNFARLYEFILHCLESPSENSILDALQVLTTLQEGFQTIRTQALELERQGHIEPLERTHSVQTLA